ncbi:Xaa-Pro dipeptidase [Bryocella elongata]|uniref:Xaa-Pro dipeptidase n=1 Tax=Bryocella elongata TaxID=863522 RepID=A0A1H6C2P1_9BACT|nr:Xaa-Pro peptidase family protein [Bryocella elongata]SEG67218.1 Xaa-Pro dipeptidase [Bryocella elongata]
MITRRSLLGASAGAALSTVASPFALQAQRPAAEVPQGPVPEAIARLPSFAGKVAPFTNDERLARIARAKELMGQQKIQAIVLANSTSNTLYFANVRLGASERLWALVIPARAKPFIVCPAFEHDRAVEMLEDTPFAHEAEILTWEEDESPFALIASALKARGVTSGNVGLDENMKFTFANELMKAAPALHFVSATPVTGGCRSIKDEHELDCLRTAGAATLAVYEAVYLSLKEGMTTRDVHNLVLMAYAKTGLQGEASLNIDEFTAVPHGSRKPQTIREGSILMLDDGCVVEGYTSDITRTFCFGKPTDKMRKVFDIVKAAQTAALKTARPGIPLANVDLAARKVIADAGYGPAHKYFTHRVGHGIGMDMHEWPYLSENNMFLDDRAPILAANMTFSDEPGLYIKGEFGVRLEDELHITANAAELLTPQSLSLDEPFGKA